jgi:hypothetical protein
MQHKAPKAAPTGLGDSVETVTEHKRPPSKVNSQPWFPVGELDIRAISESFEEPAAYRSALIAYVTLRRKANLRGALAFEDRLLSMAKDMGMQYREAQRAIRLLESIGLVEVERRKIPGTNANLPSIYKLTPLLEDRSECDASRSEQDATTSRRDGVHAHITAPFPITTSQEIHPYNDSTRHSPEAVEGMDGDGDDRSGFSLAALVEEERRRAQS